MDRIIERARVRRGTTVVEAAIVLPLLLGIVLAAIQYGWLFLNAQKVTNIARQGARLAILPHGGAKDEAIEMIDALLAQAGLSDDDPARAIVSTPIAGDPDGREQITVTVSVSGTSVAILSTLWFGGDNFLGPPARLSATVTMAKEGG